MRPYHVRNLEHQPYAHWRIKVLAWVAKALSVQVKVAGMPFGAGYDRKVWDPFWGANGIEAHRYDPSHNQG